jgi:hypothetical protein
MTPPNGAGRLGKLVDILCAVAAIALPAAAYVASASSEPASWDTAELQGVPYILGVAHPTGFPFYVLAGYAWSHLVAVGSVAFRMNIMSGFAIAIMAGAAYAVARELQARPLVALIASLWFALTQDVWSHASRAEAQDIAMACCTLAIYAFVRWMKDARSLWYVLAFALVGLGMAAHPNALWVVPGLIVGSIVAKRRPPLRLVAVSVALMIAALGLYLYLPLRSAYVVAHGLDPTHVLAGASGGVFWNYNDPRTFSGLLRELSGSESGTPGYFLASFNPVHLQDALWAFISTLGTQYGAFVLVLFAIGLIVLWKRDWRTTLFLCTACTVALIFSVTYTNEGDVGRYRMLAIWLVVPILGALVPRRRGDFKAAFGAVVLAVFLAAGTNGAFQTGHGFFDHNAGEGGRWVINAVRPYVPPGSVIVVSWLDATSLAYGAYVDGSLPGRIIVSEDEMRVPVYRQWAKSRPVFMLVNPNDTAPPPGTKLYQHIDGYHDLLRVE